MRSVANVLLLLAAEAADASIFAALGGGLHGFSRFRGGADTTGSSDRINDDEATPLSEEQIMEKLNTIPTFVMMSGQDSDGLNFVSMAAPDGETAVLFFTEPDEAQDVLARTQAALSDNSIRLGTVGLGDALQLCNGFEGSNDPSFADLQEAFAETKALFAENNVVLRLRGNSALVEKHTSLLEKVLEREGIAARSWAFPVFLCTELVGPKIMPMFLSPEGFRMTSPEGVEVAIDHEQCHVMDIRMVVRDMRRKRDVPWSTVRFFGPEGALSLAKELRPKEK